MGEVHNLMTEGQALLEQARLESSGRASTSLIHGDRQRVVIIGLTAGSELAEHASPPAATLHVVSGRARLYVSGEDGQEWLLDAGDIVPIPPERHALAALSDSIVVLTVSLS